MSTSPSTAGKAGGAQDAARARRRAVLLADDEHSAIEKELAEFTGAESRGNGLHDHIQKLAQQHPGRWVAAEWEGPLGWTRFLWCKK